MLVALGLPGDRLGLMLYGISLLNKINDHSSYVNIDTNCQNYILSVEKGQHLKFGT